MTMQVMRARVLRVLGAVALATTATAFAAVAPTGAAEPGDVSAGLINGRTLGAEGSFVTAAGVTVDTGRVAPLSMDCVNDRDKVHREVVSFELPGLVALGTIVGDITATRSETQVDVTATETIQAVDLVDGLVQATGVQARAHSVLDESGVTNIMDGSTGVTIADLVVAGVHLGPLEPPPNTVIPIPLAGTLVLNEQILTPDGIIVNAMHLYVDVPLGVQGDVTVATASIELNDVGPQVGAEAYTARVNARIQPPLGIDTSKLVKVAFACRGANGIPKTITAVGIDQGPLVTSGTATNTVVGQSTPTEASATATAVVEQLSVLDGLITATAVTAEASTVSNAGGSTNTGSSELVDLVVAGAPIAVSVPPNTRISLPGIGYVLLNGQQPIDDGSFAGMTTTAIRVVVNVSGNPFGLPVGASITVAEASTQVRF